MARQIPDFLVPPTWHSQINLTQIQISKYHFQDIPAPNPVQGPKFNFHRADQVKNHSTQVIHLDATLDQIELVDTLPHIQNKAGNQFQIKTKTEMDLLQIHGNHLNQCTKILSISWNHGNKKWQIGNKS